MKKVKIIKPITNLKVQIKFPEQEKCNRTLLSLTISKALVWEQLKS